MSAHAEHATGHGSRTGAQDAADAAPQDAVGEQGLPKEAGVDQDARPGAQPSEAELRAAYEAELSRIRSVDMVLQAAASLLNIGAHRLGLTGAAGTGAPADLEQVRDAIDAVRGLLPVIERSAPAELRPLRDALAQLQMAYTRAVQAASAPASGREGAGEPAASAPPSGQRGADDSAAPAPAAPEAGGVGEHKPGPGPAESSGRLWVPGR